MSMSSHKKGRAYCRLSNVSLVLVQHLERLQNIPTSIQFDNYNCITSEDLVMMITFLVIYLTVAVSKELSMNIVPKLLMAGKKG